MFAEEFHTNGNSSIEQIREEIWIKKLDNRNQVKIQKNNR